MITALLTRLDEEVADRLGHEMAARAVTLRAQDQARALHLLWSLPISLVVTGMPSLTSEWLHDFQALVSAKPEAVQVVISSEVAWEQVRTEELLAPDFWLPDTAGAAQQAETLRAALDKAELRSRVATATPSLGPAGGLPAALALAQPNLNLFQRLMSGLSHGLDADRLLRTYVDAAVEFVNCAGYCLLWRASAEGGYLVYAAHGLPPEVISAGRLLPGDHLPRWCLQNCRVLTRGELTSMPDPGLAAALAGELDLLRGQLVLPLLAEGNLLGMLILGEKALGGGYAVAELESLFVLSNYVAVQAQSLELHAELRRSQSYLERIVSGMSSGVITLGADERIALCNPYAAAALGLTADRVVGQDLRCLPSPLGDYLHAVLHSPPKAISGREITVRGGQLTLWISTAALVDEEGVSLGAILLLQDLTDQIDLATERHRRERLDLLTQIIGTIAHGVRTPLTAVKTYIELAGSAASDPELEEFRRETVSPQLDRLDSLIDQMVHMVQQPEPNFELVRPEALVEEALRQVFAGAGTPPQVEVRGILPRIIADPGPTREAIVYLMRYLREEQEAPLYLQLAAEGAEGAPGVCLLMRSLRPLPQNLRPEQVFDPISALQATDADLGPVISSQIMENQGAKVEAQVANGSLEFRMFFPVLVLGGAVTREGSSV